MGSDNIFGWPNGTIGNRLEEEFVSEVKKLCGLGLAHQRMLQILSSMLAERSRNDYVHAMRLADNTCDSLQLYPQHLQDLAENKQVVLESCGKKFTLTLCQGKITAQD